MNIISIIKSYFRKDKFNHKIKANDLIRYKGKPYAVEKRKLKCFYYLGIPCENDLRNDGFEIKPLSEIPSDEIEYISKNCKYYEKVMPAGCHNNNVYNALIKWVKKCKVKSIGVVFDYNDNIIHIYTNRPGILIGRHGSLISEVENEIRSQKHYENYSINIHEVGGIISQDSVELTDAEMIKQFEDLMQKFSEEDSSFI